MVGGRLVLHAAMCADRVMISAEVEIEPTPRQGKAAAAAGPRARLEDVAARAREIIRNVRERPTFSPEELVGAIVGIVDIAEEDEDEADSPT
jgi:hypothetical protein